jgi:hypothetical protein
VIVIVIVTGQPPQVALNRWGHHVSIILYVYFKNKNKNLGGVFHHFSTQQLLRQFKLIFARQRKKQLMHDINNFQKLESSFFS